MLYYMSSNFVIWLDDQGIGVRAPVIQEFSLLHVVQTSSGAHPTSSFLIDLHIMYKNKEIANTCNTKFLRLTLDNTFSWKNHIYAVVPKLSLACFAVRAVTPFLSQETLRMVYFSYFHYIMTYGLVFWGNSYHSDTVFKLQKRIIRIMVGLRYRESCREYYRKLKILPLQSQY
jgi:hypothetical protein